MKKKHLTYLDSQLLTYVERFERHVDSDVKQQMYDDAYALLSDIDITLDIDMELQVAEYGVKKNGWLLSSF